MRDSNYSILKVLVTTLVFVTILTSCLGSDGKNIPTKYYLIDPMEYDVLNFIPDVQMSVEIIDVHIHFITYRHYQMGSSDASWRIITNIGWLLLYRYCEGTCFLTLPRILLFR